MRFLRTENTKILDVWFVKNEKGLRVVVFQNISDKNMKCVKSMKIMSRKCVILPKIMSRKCENGYDEA